MPNPNEGSDLRTAAERDRDRILYSSAFRRLGNVTQVVGTAEIQLFHNRLTHSLKVAQIGRRLAERLTRTAPPEHLEAAGWIDPNVVESACMAHDLGHPPFGHIAEEELQRCFDDFKTDSFEGNAQSFRIVNKLAVRSLEDPAEKGLNLTRATLRAILKYPWAYGADEHLPKSRSKWGTYFSERSAFERALEGYSGALPAAEARLMDWADDVAYAVHDVEDFFRAGLIPLDRLASSLEERRRFLEYLGQRFPKWDPKVSSATLDSLADVVFPSEPYSGSVVDRATLHDFASYMIGRYLSAVTLDEKGEVHLGDEERIQVEILKQLTWMYVIDDPALATIQAGYRRVVRELFGQLQDWTVNAWDDFQRSARLPTQLRNLMVIARDDSEGWKASGNDSNVVAARVTADYISSLTEAQALNLHLRLTGGEFRGSALESWLRR